MEQIASRLRDLPTTHYGPGALLLREGGSDGRLYVLAAGAVAVVRAGVQVAVVDKAGALFGEMSVLRGVPHSASVRAITDCTVHVVDNARTWMQERPDVAMFVANLLAERLATTTALLVEAQAADDGRGTAQAGLFSRLFGALSGTVTAPSAGGERFIHE